MTGADYAGWQITVIQLIVSRAGQKSLQGHLCWTPNCRKHARTIKRLIQPAKIGGLAHYQQHGPIQIPALHLHANCLLPDNLTVIL